MYKIDTDAIRNLSNLAKDLTVNGKLTVPGGLDIKDKLDVEKNTYVKGLLKVNRTDDHPWNPGWGNGVHTWDMKVDASADINNLSVRNNLSVSKNVNVANDLVFNGKNNWIFHTPNDGRHIVYISPSKAQGNLNWDWGKGLELHPNGKVIIKGDLKVDASADINNLTVRGNFNLGLHLIKVKSGDWAFKLITNKSGEKYNGNDWILTIAGFNIDWNNRAPGAMKLYCYLNNNLWHIRSEIENAGDDSDVNILCIPKKYFSRIDHTGMLSSGAET